MSKGMKWVVISAAALVFIIQPELEIIPVIAAFITLFSKD